MLGTVWLSRQNFAPEDAPIKCVRPLVAFSGSYAILTSRHFNEKQHFCLKNSQIPLVSLVWNHIFPYFPKMFPSFIWPCYHAVKNTTGLLKLSSMMAAVRPAYEKKRMQLWLDSPVLRENLENPYFEGNTSGFRLRFSLKSVISILECSC